MTNETLTRDESHIFSLNWTPTIFGIHTMTLKVFDDNITYDTVERIVAVGIHEFEWWNESWHYRYFMSTENTGVLSKMFNFTVLLNDLNVSGEEFENDTIRIVRYNSNGEVVKVVDEYLFNESSTFDQVDNSIGTLIWNASDVSGLKYYLIYFDVGANPGDRTILNETISLNFTESVIIDQTGIVDGWWSIINKPLENGFAFKSDPIQINVSTTSIANNVSASVFLSANISHIYPLNLSNSDDGTEWLSDNFLLTRKVRGPLELRVLIQLVMRHMLLSIASMLEAPILKQLILLSNQIIATIDSS